jgi:phosphoadenosine phosphosulfate reductase
MLEQRIQQGVDETIAPRDDAPIALRSEPVVQAKALADALENLSPAERLVRLRRELNGPIVFTHGFGIEGQVIFHWLCERGLDIDVVTLDTGRLFPETYALWAETERRYGRRIRAVYPDHAALEKFVDKQGIDGFYESKRARQACCDVRKTQPIERALAGASAWITGLRADQSVMRKQGSLISFDTNRDVLKLNPLFDWSRDAVMAVVQADGIPINALHAKGFASIGCAPCTRAIAPGDPERSGRWWWENGGSRECGLHLPKSRGKTRAPSQPATAPTNCGCG